MRKKNHHKNKKNKKEVQPERDKEQEVVNIYILL